MARITVALACPKTIQQYASLATRHMYFHLFIIVCYLANNVLLLVAAIVCCYVQQLQQQPMGCTMRGLLRVKQLCGTEFLCLYIL